MSDLPQFTTNSYLNGKPHSLHLTVGKLSLNLTLTNKNTWEKWKSSPTVEYVESMTRKTGNFKTFPVFAEMMKAVFLNGSPSLSVKLFTQEELEKLNDPTYRITTADNKTNKRVYFILVYTSEFDRIHYPLPMDYAGLPNADVLQATINGLEIDKRKLTKELELSQIKTDLSQKEIGSLKIALFETAQKCQTTVEELGKLKETIIEERNSWKRELVQIRTDYNSKMDGIASEMKYLANYVERTVNQFPLGRFRSPKRNPSGGRTRSSIGISPLAQSPRKLSSRPNSPRSISSFGSINRHVRPIKEELSSTNKSMNFCRSGNLSDNDVDSMRLQIEALQRTILSLSNNLKQT